MLRTMLSGMHSAMLTCPRRCARVQVVITPCEKYMPWSNEKIAEEMHRQVQQLFPSARQLTNTWHSVVKIQQSLYRCARGSPLVSIISCSLCRFALLLSRLCGAWTTRDGAAGAAARCCVHWLALASVLHSHY